MRTRKCNLENFRSILTNQQVLSVDDIIDSYKKTEHIDEELSKAVSKLKQKSPELFSTENDILDKLTIETLSNLTLETVLSEKRDEGKKVQTIISEIQSNFPDTNYTVNSREKSLNSIIENIKKGSKYWFSDIFGVRVVPKDARCVSSTLKSLERLISKNNFYTLNTFAYSNKEMASRLPYSSIYYKAFHFYVPIKSFFLEIQVRTPMINVWSELHHNLVYKPLKNTTNDVKDCLNVLGRMANLTDMSDILNMNTLKS